MIKVTCAVIEKDDQILIAQRSEKMDQALKWEFPGGKLKEGEEEKEGLKREIHEELSIEIIPVHRLPDTVYEYPDNKIMLLPYICKYKSGELRLKEHRDFKWINPIQFQDYVFCKADIEVIQNYMEFTTP